MCKSAGKPFLMNVNEQFSTASAGLALGCPFPHWLWASENVPPIVRVKPESAATLMLWAGCRLTQTHGSGHDVA